MFAWWCGARGSRGFFLMAVEARCASPAGASSMTAPSAAGSGRSHAGFATASAGTNGSSSRRSVGVDTKLLGRLDVFEKERSGWTVVLS